MPTAHRGASIVIPAPCPGLQPCLEDGNFKLLFVTPLA
jgi:hypothetical protein